MQALKQRRAYIDQAVQSTFGLFGTWNSLQVLLYGHSFAHEKFYLKKKGVREENFIECDGDPENILSKTEADLLLIEMDSSQLDNSYEKFISLLNKLRNSTQKKRVIIVETGILGYKQLDTQFDDSNSIKQIYLQILSKLEKILKDDYIHLHEKLIREVSDEDYEHRLTFLYSCKEVADILDQENLKEDFATAQVHAVVRSHASKSFESGFIAGDEDELQKMHKLLKPKQKWENFKNSFPKGEPEHLHWLNMSESQIDTDTPLRHADMWNELEDYSGEFLDFHCGKAFNRLSAKEKVDITGEDRFEDKSLNSEPAANMEVEDSGFRKFAIEQNPLESLMGQSANPFNSMSPQGMPAPSGQNEKISLAEYKEVMLAILASWHRQCVYVGGSLFEYCYENDDQQLILGCTIALDQDTKLLHHVNNLAESFGLPNLKKKIDTKLAIKSLFAFNKAYLVFYDKIRTQLKKTPGFHIGPLKIEDYNAELAAEQEAEKKIQIDLKARREKERKKSLETERRYKAHLERIKILKEQRGGRPQKVDEDQSDNATEKNVDRVKIDPNQLQQMNEDLELKRLELEEQIEEERKKREELEDAIKQEQEIRDLKRKEIEEERKRKQELEKAERLKRQQRLAEERKKREDVKKMRAKNLRDAFEKAREAAIKKQQNKINQGQKQGGGDEADKKAEKKKYNPEAVKMMIRFGTDDKKIISTTGIDEDDLKALRDEVQSEDQQLTS